MADLKISQLLSTATPTNSDELAIVQGGITKKITFQHLLSLHLPLTGGNMSGDIIFSGSTGIDTTNAGASDTLNIGANYADIVNVGRTGATVNLKGSVAYIQATNLQVTDKLITINKGGASSSGDAAGFEIEENSAISGYFKTNTARTGFSLKAPANSYYADLITSSLTANRQFTFPDATGTFIVGTLTTAKALVSNGGAIAESSVTTTELGYVSGVTSAIQTQIDGKQPLDTQLTSLAALSYSGNAGKFIRVNAGETGFELATASGGVTGSFTTNTIPKANGASSLTDSRLTDDGSTFAVGSLMYLTSGGNLGVGASPSYRIHATTSASNAGFAHTAGSLTIASYLDSSLTHFGAYSNHDMNLMTGGQTGQYMLYLKHSNKSVGVWTNSPSSNTRLHAVGDRTSRSAITGQVDNTSTTLGTGYPAFELVNADSTTNNWSYFVFSSSAGGNYYGSISCQYVNRASSYGDIFISQRTSAGYLNMVSIVSNKIGLGQSVTPTALVHIGAGTSSLAQLKLNTSTLLTTPEAGAVEYSGDYLYYTGSTSTTRKTVNGLVYRGITSARTLDGSDELIDCTSGTFAVTLPTAVGFTGQYKVKNSGTGVITINTTSSQTVDGYGSGIFLINPGEWFVFRSNGSNWIIVG